jgi:hypothetical protein
MRLPFCVIDKKLTFATPRVLISLSFWLPAHDGAEMPAGLRPLRCCCGHSGHWRHCALLLVAGGLGRAPAAGPGRRRRPLALVAAGGPARSQHTVCSQVAAHLPLTSQVAAGGPAAGAPPTWRCAPCQNKPMMKPDARRSSSAPRRMAALHRHIASCSDSSSSSRRLLEIGSNVPSLGDFTGKLVLVTGAGHGIGRHVAVLFQRLGASVWGADLRFDDWGAPLDGAELVASPLADERVVDVTDPIAVRRWVRDAEAAHSGAVFVLINCAGGVGGYP